MTPSEAVLMDLLMERGYTREQAARALVALTLDESEDAMVRNEIRYREERRLSRISSHEPCAWAWAELTVEAERRGLLKEEL